MKVGLSKSASQIMQAVDGQLAALGKGASVKVGFLNEEMATIAFFNEYGTISRVTLGSYKAISWNKVNVTGPWHIPPRPFFRTMVEAKSPTWGKLIAAALKMTGNDTETAMEIVGIKVSEQLQESIVKFKDPANAPSTIAQKGFDDPLINTGDMLRSVEYQVEGGQPVRRT